jgi:hypothetical protein
VLPKDPIVVTRRDVLESPRIAVFDK